MTPRTLPALRAACAPLLAARGLAAAALYAQTLDRGDGYEASVYALRGDELELSAYATGRTEADAIAAVWARLCARVRAEATAAEAALVAAEARARVARAAVEACDG